MISAIKELKKKKNALVLAHYYQGDEIQDIADDIGDSYHLAKIGQSRPEDFIVMCGVVFMAESIKILSPHKRVFVPDLKAGCSLVYGSPFDAYKSWKDSHPNSVMVTYINSSAEIKSISDVIVTSSNAEKIISSIPKDKTILFGPDQYLGKWISKKINRPMEFWNGACEVHVRFSLKSLVELKALHPQALVLSHPECLPEIIELSDVTGSTSLLLETVKTQTDTKEFIIVTEPGILHQMKRHRPDANIMASPGIEGCQCNTCPYMKLNSLEKIKNVLEKETNEIFVRPELIGPSQRALERMIQITSGTGNPWN